MPILNKQKKFERASKRAKIFSRFIQANFDRNEKTAVFLVNHPKITLWLMKKDPRIALAITALLVMFYPKNKKIDKKISKQSIKSFFQLMQEKAKVRS